LSAASATDDNSTLIVIAHFPEFSKAAKCSCPVITVAFLGLVSLGVAQGSRSIAYGLAPPHGSKIAPVSCTQRAATACALDLSVDLPGGATKAQLLDAMKGHLLAKGQLVGNYGR
jgi:phosphatidylethanolamine-binding protein (PEBP) family uncharacterized protein